MKKIIVNILIINLLLFVNHAYSVATTEDISAGIKLFLTKQITVQHKTVDPDTIDITLYTPNNFDGKICNRNVNYYFPIYANIYGKTTVVVAECKDRNNPWKIYVPVSMKFMVEALSVKKSLPKLHVINNEDLMAKKIKVMTLEVPYIVNPTSVVGLKLKNSVKQNTVLTMNLLEQVQYGA